MFIHIGTIDIPLTKSRGEFFCPNCQRDTEYLLKKRKRFLAVYFIPLIPLSDVDEYVKCATCRQKFGVEIPALMAEGGAELLAYIFFRTVSGSVSFHRSLTRWLLFSNKYARKALQSYGLR